MPDGAGDAAQAGGAVRGGIVCANCGQERSDRFCAKCGQNDRDYIRALPPVLGDILKETFELDSRLLRTVKPMFLRPGELPSEFSRNRRASYVSPIRFYIFASLVFFFLLSFTADWQPPRGERAMVRIGEPAEQGEREDANVDALRALLPPWQQRKLDDLLAHPGRSSAKSIVYGLTGLADNYEQFSDWERFWTALLLARLVDVLDDPRAALALLVDNLPFAMFVTLPAYAVLLKLFFAGSRRYFTEHLVFAVQLHTFAFIVFAVLVILPGDDRPGRQGGERTRAVSVGEQASEPGDGPVERLAADSDRGLRIVRNGEDAEDDEDDDDRIAPLEWVELLLTLWVPAYHYLALRRYYGNGRAKTAVKWAMLSFAYAILLVPGFLLSLALTFVQL